LLQPLFSHILVWIFYIASQALQEINMPIFRVCALKMRWASSTVAHRLGHLLKYIKIFMGVTFLSFIYRYMHTL